MPIKYLVGNALDPQGPGNKLIAHICNDEGRWGAGFVLAVSKKFGTVEEAYRKAYKDGILKLGSTQFVDVRDMEGDRLVFANMIAQRSTGFMKDGSPNGCPPIRYNALFGCIDQACTHAALINASIHGPRFGAGLAGGEWKLIEVILNAASEKHGVPFTIYDLEELI